LFESGRVHTLALHLGDDAVASLRAAPTTEVEADLEWDLGRYRVAVRIKGSASLRTIDEKPSFKVDAHAYDPEARIDGLKRLTLNNMVQDRTLLREHTYYLTSRTLGLPAPRHAYVWVTVNDAPYGLYSLVESMDEQLLKRAFADDPDGNLYEASGADFTWERDWFELEESGEVVPTDDIAALVDAVEATRSGGFDDLAHARFDREALLTWLALDIVAGNDDGYVFNHHNYLAYHTARSDRWWLVPWGTDRAFTRAVPPGGDLGTPVVGQLALACQADPVCGPDLGDAIHEVLEHVEAEVLPGLYSQAEAIRPWAEADTRREHTFDPEDLLEFLEERRNTLGL
jgi:spore coat protein CotH